MEMSIDDIKLILEGKLSIRDALETKHQSIKKHQMKLENIDKQINEYIKRKRVYITTNEKQTHPKYITLYYNNSLLRFCDITIDLKNILSVDISLCCSKGADGRYYGIHNFYYVDLDVYTKKDTYSFQLMNNDQVIDLCDSLIMSHIIINDPLHIVEIYHQYRDPIQLNKYIDRHFSQWAKEYQLDNPRTNYFDIIKEDYIDVLAEFKEKGYPVTVKGQFHLLKDKWIKLLKRIFRK